MLIKLLTEARKGQENSSAKCDSLFWPEDGYIQLVINKLIKSITMFHPLPSLIMYCILGEKAVYSKSPCFLMASVTQAWLALLNAVN